MLVSVAIRNLSYKILHVSDRIKIGQAVEAFFGQAEGGRGGTGQVGQGVGQVVGGIYGRV